MSVMPMEVALRLERSQLAGFVAAVAVLVIVPGPNTALILARSLAGERGADLLPHSAMTGALGAPAPTPQATASVVHQLRIYEIFEANRRQFHERFRDHATRIMARHDFGIVATWESCQGDRRELVYLLEWPDKETMRDRWAWN